MKTKCVIVMPPIYRFLWKDEELQNIRKWGWHKASELLVALNGIFIANGKDDIDVGKFISDNPKLHPYEGGAVGPYYAFPGQCLMVTADGESEVVYPRVGENVTAKGDWLSPLAKQGYYVPAAVGMKLIEAAKKSSTGWFERIMG
jgi:hypothetical protein